MSSRLASPQMMVRVKEDGAEVGEVEERDPVERWWHPLPSLPVGQLPADQQGAASQLRLGGSGGAKKLVVRKQGELQMEVTQSQMWSWSCPLEW